MKRTRFINTQRQKPVLPPASFSILQDGLFLHLKALRGSPDGLKHGNAPPVAVKEVTSSPVPPRRPHAPSSGALCEDAVRRSLPSLGRRGSPSLPPGSGGRRRLGQKLRAPRGLRAGRAGPGAAPGRSGSADRGRLPAAGKEARGGARAGVRHGYLHHHVVGQLRGAEELQDAPVGRHLLGALGVAVGEEVAVVALLRLAQRQALHLTPRFRAALPPPRIQRRRRGGRGNARGRLAPGPARRGGGGWTPPPRAPTNRRARAITRTVPSANRPPGRPHGGAPARLPPRLRTTAWRARAPARQAGRGRGQRRRRRRRKRRKRRPRSGRRRPEARMWGAARSAPFGVAAALPRVRRWKGWVVVRPRGASPVRPTWASWPRVVVLVAFLTQQCWHLGTSVSTLVTHRLPSVWPRSLGVCPRPSW